MLCMIHMARRKRIYTLTQPGPHPTVASSSAAMDGGTGHASASVEPIMPVAPDCPHGMQIHPARLAHPRRVLGCGFWSKEEFIRWIGSRGVPPMNAVQAEAVWQAAVRDVMYGDTCAMSGLSGGQQIIVEISCRIVPAPPAVPPSS